MKTMIVWYLVYVSTSYSGSLQFSPPMTTKEDCEQLRQTIKQQVDNDFLGFDRHTRCVQIKEVVK